MPLFIGLIFLFIDFALSGGAAIFSLFDFLLIIGGICYVVGLVLCIISVENHDKEYGAGVAGLVVASSVFVLFAVLFGASIFRL